jgi:hypothetical protein
MISIFPLSAAKVRSRDRETGADTDTDVDADGFVSDCISYSWIKIS